MKLDAVIQPISYKCGIFVWTDYSPTQICFDFIFISQNNIYCKFPLLWQLKHHNEGFTFSANPRHLLTRLSLTNG